MQVFWKLSTLTTDTNDSNPVFKTEGGGNEIYVNGSDPVGTYLTKMMAQDRDGSEKRCVLYSVSKINLVTFEINHYVEGDHFWITTPWNGVCMWQYLTRACCIEKHLGYIYAIQTTDYVEQMSNKLMLLTHSISVQAT